MEWKLIGSSDAPAGFENVQIDENNLAEHREILRTLAIKAIKGGTIKLCKKAEETKSKDETVYDYNMADKAYEKKYLDKQKEWEEKFLKSLENDSTKKKMEIEGFTPLMVVAMRGTTETCKKLISEGAEIDKLSKVEPMPEGGDNENNFNGCTALMWAAMMGELENFKFLMSAGADISKETPAESGNGGCTALHCAVKGGHLEICKLLVSGGADIDKESTKGLTPLMYAAKINNLELCKLLVSAGADIHKESKMGWTPLMFAASGKYPYGNVDFYGNDIGQWDICKFFIDAGADVNKKSKDGLNLFMIALNSQENVGISELCFKLPLFEPDMPKNTILNPKALACAAGKGCRDEISEEKNNYNGYTELMWAAVNWSERRPTYEADVGRSELDKCKLLLSEGADISKETPEESGIGGCTALHLAAKAGWLDICELLVLAGADIDKESTKGITPLMYAAKKNHLSICKLLMSAGADIHKESKMGWTSLMFAASGEPNWATCKYFIDAGADVNKKSVDGLDVYMIALNSLESLSNEAICSRLALLEPDMPKNAILNPNALACAAEKGYTDICELFIMLGANVDKEDKDGWTPLLKAAYNDKLSSIDRETTCELLISSGANVEKEVLLDKEPTTALMLAINKGHTSIAKILLKAGANTDKISEVKLEILKEKSDVNSPATVKEYTSSAEENKEEMPVYDTCKNIDEAEDLREACYLKINKSDDNAMTALLEKCKNLISAGANIDVLPYDRDKYIYREVTTPLMNAASHGYTEICKMLIAAGVDVNDTGNWGTTALLSAAGSGHTEICEMLISAGANIEYQTHTGQTVLSTAMRNHHIETCRFLVSAGSPLSYDGCGGYTTALICAAENNMTEICDLLITSMGANIEEENGKGETALIKAVECCKVEACRYLISAGANTEKEDHYGNTALTKTYWYDNDYTDIYKELISGGANVDKQISNGLTLLMQIENPEICQLFISAGANINLQDPNGKTALMHSLEKTNICHQLLISAGADLNLQDSTGETALMKAVKNDLVNACKILIAAGADVTIETSEKNELRLRSLAFGCSYTALHLAVLHAQQAGYIGNHNNNYKEIVKMLISAGANIDQETAEGWTPLMVFLKRDHCYAWKMCRELILGGADINKKNKDGWTPLMIAIRGPFCGDKPRIVSMLIKLGADITTETMPNGETMLSSAVDTRSDICETLIRRGADVNKEDEGGWTPLMSAVRNNEQYICTLFISAGANVDKEYLMVNSKKLRTALMLAAEISLAWPQRRNICDILVSAGANILSTTHYSG